MQEILLREILRELQEVRGILMSVYDIHKKKETSPEELIRNVVNETKKD